MMLVKNKAQGPQEHLPQQQEKISEEAHEPRAHAPVLLNSLKWFESPLGTLDNEKLQKPLTEQAATVTSLQKENAELHQKNHSLSMELTDIRKKFEQLKDEFKQAASF